MAPKKTDMDGWELISAKTTAHVTRSWTDGGKHLTEEECIIGAPETVRQQCGAKYPGEATQVESVHTIKKYAREYTQNTTSGVIKQRQECTEQSDDFGDGKGASVRSAPAQRVCEDVEEPEAQPEQGPSGLQVLKNFVDNVAASQRVHTVLLVAIGILATVGAILGFVALAR